MTVRVTFVSQEADWSLSVEVHCQVFSCPTVPNLCLNLRQIHTGLFATCSGVLMVSAKHRAWHIVKGFVDGVNTPSIRYILKIIIYFLFS